MIEALGAVFNKERQAEAAAWLSNTMHDFAARLAMYGSDAALVAYRNFMQGVDARVGRRRPSTSGCVDAGQAATVR